jgi:hypothetical protein
MSPGGILEWRVHPVRENPLASVLVGLLLLVIWAGTYLVFHEVIWVILAVIFLGGSLLPFFTVTEYRMDDRGITIRRPLTTVFREWDRVRSYYPDRKGVLLSPFAAPSRLENFRGVFIRFGPDRQAVIQYLKKHVGQSSEHTGNSGTTTGEKA